ncbi:MAG: hypothetical protein ABR551_10540 [Gemmatimonadales bacterium]
MGVILRVEEAGGLPRVAWRWEPETDILAGSLSPAPSGPAGSLELSGHDGSVAVVDLTGGRVAGLDVVVWPEVVTVPELVVPAAVRSGTIRVMPANGAPESLATLELDVALSARANLAEDLIHLRVGAPRPTVVVQVADCLQVEVDEGGGLAGFWLSEVPPLLNGDS